jgi:hypothetical protein
MLYYLTKMVLNIFEPSVKNTAIKEGDVVNLLSQPGVYGRVGVYLPDRERWTLTLFNGVMAAARDDQLQVVPIEPGTRVKVSLVAKGTESESFPVSCYFTDHYY